MDTWITKQLSSSRIFDAFAMFVDINGFERMTESSQGNLIATFIHDIIVGGLTAVENEEGHIAALTGDGFLALFNDGDRLMRAIFRTVDDLDRLREYLYSNMSDEDLNMLCPDGLPSIKILVEYGWIDTTLVRTKSLGKQHLFIGPPINYAARLGGAGRGNRCLFGPTAKHRPGPDNYSFTGPLTIAGKHSSMKYEYYQLELSDQWVEGDPSSELDPSVR